jgi:dephospho-CoA kinase
MIRAGLTGGIATGKSTVARLLAAVGVPVIDADQVSREIVAPGQPALEEIVDSFGPEVLESSGALDRDAMRGIVLREPRARQELERITHPRIRTRIEDWIREQSAPAVVVEAALLVETGSYKEYDLLIVVQCSEPTQLQRLINRNQLTEAEARRWLSTQLPLSRKAALADFLIENNGDIEALRAQIGPLLERLGSSD